MKAATNARDAVQRLETAAPLLEGVGDRFSGYAIVSVPFRSGHVLALRRCSASSVGPSYTSVWHRDPSGRWTFYATVAPDVSCARYFGAQVERNIVTPIDITWTDSMRLRVVVGTIEWQIDLARTTATQLLNAVAKAIPEGAWQRPALLSVMGLVGRIALGTGRVRLTGCTPNGHRFIGTPRRLWAVASSQAVVDGVNVGPMGRLDPQVTLADFALPHRGLFVVARARFERPASTSVGNGAAERSCVSQVVLFKKGGR